MSPNSIIPQDLIDTMIKDQRVRISITKESHWYFFHFYFAHYVKYATAEFQREMIHLTESETVKNFCIVSFRGSGKSTIATTSYPIWAILGKQEKKFVLILCQTRSQAKQHMMNLRRELEDNPILKNDLGPFQEENDEWGSNSLVFSNQGARITVASSEQSIRGLRHHQHRPDLIICDDVEDLASSKTREGRQKTYQWLTSEVIPAGDRNTKLVVIGNLLHEDSLLMRLGKDIREKKLDGEFRAYPLLDENNKIIWSGKYPTMADIEDERRKVGNDIAWKREYLLKIIPDEDQIIDRTWIKRYEKMPHRDKLQSIRVGVDLAISQRDTADYTAMVIGWVYSDSKNDTYQVYIDQIVINKRMGFPETVETCQLIHKTFKETREPDFIIEDVGYQRALPELLEQQGLSSKATGVGSQDKRSRLNIVSHKIKSGQVLFPSKGCEMLIEQIVNFGVEKHDDLVDAFTMLMIDVIEDPPYCPTISWIDVSPRREMSPVWRPLFGP